MQPHNNLSAKKNKDNKANIGGPDVIEKNLKKNNSFSSFKNKFIDDKNKCELIIKENIKKHNNLSDDSNDFNETKANLRRRTNFMLKSEFYNLNYKKESKNDKIKDIFDKANLINNFYKNDTNNILNNAQLNQNNPTVNNTNLNNKSNINNIFIINNIQNYPGFNFQPSLYQHYTFPKNQYFNNNYYNYNNNISFHRSNLFINNNINQNNYINLAKTQSGSKFLQEKILFNKEFANDILYPELKNNLKEICNDIYGSSLLQILFKQLRYENLNSFLSLIKDDMNNICLTEQGSHVIQSLIENIKEHPLLINKFIFNLNSKDLMKIFLSPYGNHIIKCYLSTIKQKEFTNFIYNFVYNNFIDIVKEKYGVCTIQKCLSEGDETVQKQIIELILKNLDYTIKNDFGNYLIQYIFTKMKDLNFELILPLITKIEENLLDFCKYKYSASVLEKCFERGDEKISQHFLTYLLENHSNDIIYIAANQYGFFVIKKSFFVNNVEAKKKIINIIKKDLNRLNYESKEKKLVYSLLKEFSEFLC